MPVTVVMGSQWGDEGKARIVDYFAAKSDLVVRFQGGANAGHTVMVEGEKYIFHLVPCGAIHPGKLCVIGNGVVVDPVALIGELDELSEKGIDLTGRFFISENAHLVMPYHKLMDELREAALGGSAIGTTKRGIGPCYEDKVGRTEAIRVGDLLDPASFRDRVNEVVECKNVILKGVFDHGPLDGDKMADEYLALADRLRPCITDTGLLISEALDEGKSVLLEGAQGTLLDVDHGTYPYVTSSNTTAGGACTGSGIGPTMIDQVVGTVKAYTSRVGNGPFPTEFEEEFGNKMRDEWGEYGASTNRPRRIGWFDSVITRYSARINGFTGLAVTAMDRLDVLPELKICVAYKIDGKQTEHFPTRLTELTRAEPVYETLPGWNCSTTNARKFADLPKEAQNYVRRIEELTGVPVIVGGVGPNRHETVVFDD